MGIVLLASVAMLAVIDVPAMSKISAGALIAFALLAGQLTMIWLTRHPREWSRPAMLMGVDPARRRRRALSLGRRVEQVDVELVVDLRAKLRAARWLMLLCVALVAGLGPLRFFLRTDGQHFLRWAALLSVACVAYCVAESFLLYRQAGRALDAHGQRRSQK